MFMASCSKDINPISSSDPDAWMYDETLPVPIMFTTGGAPMTKSIINEVKDMDGKTFGFFAVNGNVADWSKANGLSMPQNAAATVSMDNLKDGKVRFAFNEGPYYYDQTSWDPYTFYGYHAHVAEPDNYGKTVTMHADSIFVRTEIGRTDILWGWAKAKTITKNEVEYEGFNARYIRNTQLQPEMNFKHLTACVSFGAMTKKPQYAVDMTDADVVKITGVKVLNTVTVAELCVAHKDTTRQGQFGKLSGVNVPRTGNIAVAKDVDGTVTALDVIISDQFTSLGQPLFLYPSEAITVEIEYESVANGVAGMVQKFTSQYTLAPTVADGSAVDGFVPGYEYKYNFVVYSPEKIVIEATVEPYKSAFGQDGEGNDIYKDVLPDNE